MMRRRRSRCWSGTLLALAQVLIAVVASEAGLESEVPLEITVIDTNDNPPTFTLPLYTATIKEDIAIGTLIVKGTCAVADSYGETACVSS